MRLPLWRLTTLRRRLLEAVGSGKYSQPAMPAIQAMLGRLFSGSGYFVEAGAVDGVFESNTYYLERFRGWDGVLVEPVPEMFRRLQVNRPRARAFNCALVADGFADQTVPIIAAHAMSRIGESPLTDESQPVRVPARTLTSVLDEARAPAIDLLSLDVEGFELEVLKGLDFSRYQPRFMLIECLDEPSRAAIDAFLSDRYQRVERVTYRDYLYAAREPGQTS